MKLFSSKTQKVEKKKDSKLAPLVDDTPYYFSPSFINHAGKYSCIVQLYVRTGSNRNMSFTDVIGLVPVSPMQGVDLYFIVKDGLIKDDAKKRLIKNNASSTKSAIVVEQKEEEDKKTATASKIEMQNSEYEDYDDYELIMDTSDPIVGFQIQLLLIADSMTLLDEQIGAINVSLSKTHDGCKWDSIGGDQFDRFVGIYEGYVPSKFDLTSTGRNYANLDFGMSAGLVDPKGVPIGGDALSVTDSFSFFDFDTSLKKQAIISAPASSYAVFYNEEGFLRPTLSSTLAQLGANQLMMNGHRVHHIVLNEFDYFDEAGSGIFIREPAFLETMAKYDVSKVTINPLQGFGKADANITNVYSRLVKKIVNIFDILEDLSLTQDDKAIILTAVEQFYFTHGLWIAEAAKYPKRTSIVDIPNPETYPTMSVLLNNFSSLVRRAIKNNRELKADRIDTLFSILNSALSENISILGRPTSIQPTDKPQVYYDFSSIESLKTKQIQYLNLLEYVIHSAKAGDAIIIHGYNNIYNTLSERTLDSILAGQKKGVRFIFSFDTITASKSQYDEMTDMFKMKGSYYVDLDSGVDFSMIGTCLPNEVDLVGDALNKELSDTIKSQMMNKDTSQILIHRNSDNVNNFVHSHFVI